MDRYLSNESSGWVKLYRCFLQHPISTSGDIHLFKLAIYVLLKVNHKENKFPFAGKEMVIPAGSGIFGLNQIVRDLTGYQSEKSKKFKKFKTLYYRKLQTLQNIGFLKLKPYNKFTVISIINWEKYQAKRKKCNSSVTQMKLNCNSSVTKQEVYKNDKNEEETTQHLDDVISKIFQIFKGSMKQSKIQNLIRGKDPDEMLRLAHYCSEKGENPPGLFTTMVKENAKVPKEKEGRPKISPPKGGYQTGKEPLISPRQFVPEEVMALFEQYGEAEHIIDKRLWKFLERYHEKYDPKNYYADRQDLTQTEIENMIAVAKKQQNEPDNTG